MTDPEVRYCIESILQTKPLDVTLAMESDGMVCVLVDRIPILRLTSGGGVAKLILPSDQARHLKACGMKVDGSTIWVY